MSLQFEGKVAFITGAARGQGRSHAVRFAEEGADIVAIDLCEQIDSVAYSMATPEDLNETINPVEKTGRRIVAEQADVRDFKKLQAVVTKGVSELGRIDYVLANAGIMPIVGKQAQEMSAFLDAVDVMLNGVYNTTEAATRADTSLASHCRSTRGTWSSKRSSRTRVGHIWRVAPDSCRSAHPPMPVYRSFHQVLVANWLSAL